MGCAREHILCKLHVHELNTSSLTTEMEQAFADSIVCSSVCLGGGQKKGLIKCTCNFLTVRVLCAIEFRIQSVLNITFSAVLFFFVSG